jgi:GDP-D-mannose 3',5'-epimerase
MGKILICGAGGFIGSHMAKRLYEEGNFVRAVDIKWDGFMDEPYYSEKLTLDLREYENCLKTTEGIQLVYQFAADMGGIGYITEVGADIMKNSSLININMIRASLENKIEKILFSSSACVYPEFKQLDPDVTALKEADAIPAQPDQFYGWEKLFAEKLYEGYGKDYGLDYRIARYHNIFGPYGTYEGGREKAPAALCRKVALAPDPGELEIWGDGKQTRSFCYIDDCIEGTIRLMNSDFRKPLNIGSDEMVTINEMADMIIEISGKHITKKYDMSKPQGVRGRNSDNTLIKKVLGWAPSIRLKEGLEKTYPWIVGQVADK